jgi:hypothetical protein
LHKIFPKWTKSESERTKIIIGIRKRILECSGFKKKNGNAEFNEYPCENIRIYVLFRREYQIELAFKIENVGFNKYL